ncbi:hypothetical protein AB1K80_10820 [Bacillus sp. 179-C3.3 HS]
MTEILREITEKGKIIYPFLKREGEYSISPKETKVIFNLLQRVRKNMEAEWEFVKKGNKKEYSLTKLVVNECTETNGCVSLIRKDITYSSYKICYVLSFIDLFLNEVLIS